MHSMPNNAFRIQNNMVVITKVIVNFKYIISQQKLNSM